MSPYSRTEGNYDSQAGNVVPSPGGNFYGDMNADDLKAALLDSLYGTERGLAARSEVRAEINELISQLEATTKFETADESLEQMEGDWKLLYTSNSDVVNLMALNRLPFVTVGDITQRIDRESLTVENKVSISVPFSQTAVKSIASFEVRSPRRLQLKLEKGAIQTPELLADFELPRSVTVLGQAVDLSLLQAAVDPVKGILGGVFGQVNNLMTQAPELAVKVSGTPISQSWQLNTYIDSDTRISRGDSGSVFIYVKNVSLSDD